MMAFADTDLYFTEYVNDGKYIDKCSLIIIRLGNECIQ